MPDAVTSTLIDSAVEPPVRGYLLTPEIPTGNGLVLTHGAGSNAQAPLLIALAETFSANGFTVLRCDLPYRQMRSFGPPGPADAARDRAGLKNAVAALANELGAPRVPHFSRALCARKPALSLSKGGDSRKKEQIESKGRGKIYLGGHSYGGRQCSILCAEAPDLVPALLLLSYPLHPPRKPDQQRTQHLPDLHTPTLFVHGTRDPFASIAEMQQALKMIPAKTKLLTIEGAGHDLGFKGKAKQEELPQHIFSELRTFLEMSS